MQQRKLTQILDNMDHEQRLLTVGLDTRQPLTGAFSKRRVVHAGVRGKPVAPEEWQATWQAVMSGQPSVPKRVAYIHIPFCANRCLYCGFFQKYSNEDLETVYINHLIRELEMDRGDKYLSDAPINAVFLGGGTPSTLSPHNADRLLKAIRTCLPLANDCELTLEGRINDLVAPKIEAWLENGVNRVSIGVQSFDTKVRRSVGRLDDTDTILERLALLTSYNQAVAIVDLIYGLPYQDSQVWARDLALLKTAAIDAMDLYQLNIFEGSALKKAIDAGGLPAAATTAEQAQMFAIAEEELSANMFSRLSICHWAKNNRERSMYNTLTKSGADVIPFGAGAGGNVGGVSIFLSRDVDAYLDMVAAGQKPLASMSLQAPASHLHSTVVAQLEQRYLNLHALADQFGPSVQELEVLIDLWANRGLLEKGRIASKLTTAGQFWYTNIAQSVLECLHALLDGEHQVEVQPIAAQG